MHVSDLIRRRREVWRPRHFAGMPRLRDMTSSASLARPSRFRWILAAIRRGDRGADVELKPYDILVIKPIPKWVEPGFIELAGEVRFPRQHPIHQGETLSSVLQRGGGLTDLAFAGGCRIHSRGAQESARRIRLGIVGNPPARRSCSPVARSGHQQRSHQFGRGDREPPPKALAWSDNSVDEPASRYQARRTPRDRSLPRDQRTRGCARRRDSQGRRQAPHPEEEPRDQRFWARCKVRTLARILGGSHP